MDQSEREAREACEELRKKICEISPRHVIEWEPSIQGSSLTNITMRVSGEIAPYRLENATWEDAEVWLESHCRYLFMKALDKFDQGRFLACEQVAKEIGMSFEYFYKQKYVCRLARDGFTAEFGSWADAIDGSGRLRMEWLQDTSPKRKRPCEACGRMRVEVEPAPNDFALCWSCRSNATRAILRWRDKLASAAGEAEMFLRDLGDDWQSTEHKVLIERLQAIMSDVDHLMLKRWPKRLRASE